MGKIVVCVAALLFVVKAGTVPSATIYGDALYDEGSKAYYRIHNEIVTWLTAYTTCVEEGGQLAVVTKESLPFLLSNFPYLATRVFLGFDTWQTGSWSTIHEQSLKKAGYENWSYGEPNDEGERQKCGTMYENGEFDDFYCVLKNPFICQINSFPKGYTYNEDIKSYYRFHLKPATWLVAYTTCVEEGGRLAIINSQTEADYFARNFPANAESVFLGFNNWQNGSWVTIHSTPLSEAGYEKWAPVEVNNGGGVKDMRCGTMYRSGDLGDDYCDRKLPFICEKNATDTETNSNEDYKDEDPVNNEDSEDQTVRNPAEKQTEGSAKNSEALKMETTGSSSPRENFTPLPLAEVDIMK